MSKIFLEQVFLSVEKRYDYLSANLMYNIFMTKPLLIYVSFRELLLFIHMGQEVVK